MPNQWITDLVKDLAELEELRKNAGADTWHIVFCHRGEEPECEQIPARPELLARLRDLIADGTVAYLFVFGRAGRYHITKGKFKYLIVGQERIPLFNEPDRLEADPTGNLFNEEESPVSGSEIAPLTSDEKPAS